MEEKQAGQRIDRGELKARSREAMRGRKPGVFLVSLVYVLVLALLEALSTRLLYPQLDYSLLGDAVLAGDLDMMERMFTENASFVGQLLNLAVNLMTMVLGVGFTCYCLNIARGVEGVGFGDLFDPFGYFFHAVGLSILISLFVTLWGLLLVVPGFIAAYWFSLPYQLVLLLAIPGIVAIYRYSFAYFILADDPDKPVMECLRESKELTRGHKWELFVLDLSFLGWYLLSLIPFVACYVIPYVRIARANYYRAISERMEPPVHVDISV